jgi:tetratricopeptide (TPR) repeat protein
MTVGAVGRALGVTEDTAAKRLSRAVERLRRAVLRTRDAAGSGARVHAAVTPLSAAALGEIVTRVTQSPAPSAVQAQLAALASGGATPSLLAEQVCDAVVSMLKFAQVKVVATVGALALLAVGGGVAVTSAIVRASRGPLVLAAPAPPPASAAARAGALLNEGWALWQRQQYQPAADKFRQAIDILPKSSDAWNGLGWAYFHLPDHARARSAFQRCLALEPAQGAALNGMGQLALSQGNFAEAERFLLKGAETAPAAAHGLVRLYLLQGRWDAARGWAARARATGNLATDALFRRMEAAANARRLDDELRALLSPHPPGPADALVRRAWEAMNQGRFDAAQDALDQAMAAAPDDPDVLNGMGWLHLNGGAAEESVELFEQALDRRHDHVAAANGLASAFKRLGRTDDAIRVWQDLAKRAPSTGVGQFGLAQTYLEQSAFDKALPLFEQLAATMPNNPVVQDGLERARSGARR